MTVFSAGALVMIYELIGSRIVAPYIGTSIYVWTSLIGVILGALSLGYYLGGRLADKRPDLKVMALLLLCAAGAVSVTLIVKEPLLAGIANLPVGLELQSVISALFLFAPASVLMGSITPFAVRLRITSVGETGRTVGRLYALSTIGSIAGTFAAGFLLIPFLGSQRTLYLIAGSLFVLSLALAPSIAARAKAAVLTLFVLGVAATELSETFLRSVSVHDIDTRYARVRVFEMRDEFTGRPMRALSSDPYSVQSAMYLDGDDLALRYTRYYHLLRHFRPGFQRVAMIGGAGFSFAKEFIRTYPEATLDVVEIDPAMGEIAQRYFRLKDDERLRIRYADGRVFLRNTPDASYDVVLMDAFGSLLSVPFQLTTREAVREIDRVLEPEGVAILNLASAIRGRGSRFLAAELRTYQEIFPEVAIFKVRNDRADEELQNLILVACRTKCVGANGPADPLISELLAARHAGPAGSDAEVLTDDLAPVERYASIALGYRP